MGKGIIKLSDGSIYEGDFLHGKIVGKGRFIWVDGDIYEGDFSYPVNLREYFFGRQDLYEQNDPYELTGKGKLLFKASVFEGEFKKGSLHGQGILRWDNGHVYKGAFRDGKREGEGTYIWPNRVKYQGYWKRGEEEGRAVYHWSNGDFLRVESQDHKILFFRDNDFLLKPSVRILLPKKDSAVGEMYGVVLQAEYDHNGAFGDLTKEQKLVKVLGNKYPTHYVQLRSSGELVDKISKLSKDRLGILWIQAHGSPCSMAFGAKDKVGLEQLKPILNLMAKDSLIVLRSCSTGKSSGSQESLAQMMMSHLCASGKQPILVAPNANLYCLGTKLDQEELQIAMYDEAGERVDQVFKCPK